MYTASSSRVFYLLRRNARTVALTVFFIFFLTFFSTLMNNPGDEMRYEPTRYAYQQTYWKYDSLSDAYNISVIADKDTDSKNDKGWSSELLNGVLQRDRDGIYSVHWSDNPIPLTSKMNEGGRGMELSELVYFNKRLLSCDDRTGIVYEINAEKGAVYAQNILPDGNGKNSKGFKCEWAAVKDNHLFIGGLGKEWTNPEGEIISKDPQWVKIIDVDGRVEHHSWTHVYEALRAATGTLNPGYLIHEAVRFHPILRRWFFLPRRASTLPYDDKADERRGANLMISTNEHFTDVQVSRIGEEINTHGFSSFVFLPGRENEVAALKTEEVEGVISSYITVFNLDGRILLEETKIGSIKFEGIEVM